MQTISTSSNGEHSDSLTRGNFISEGPSADLRQDDSDLVPLPMNNLYNLTDPGNSRLIRVDPADANGPDFITRGVVSESDAKFLFDHYRDHINPILCDGILCLHKSLRDARQSSSLLVAVVLTVAALHVPNREPTLHATYNAFVSLMRGTCLLRSQNLDDIRGLCIGAFYLTSLSWALCSRAVRVATEMNLHKSSLQFAREGSVDSHERVRLWYVLYVCDHQFALAYGRPPLMHEDAAIRNADKLLRSSLSSPGDGKLVSQVRLFRILADSYFRYGCDPDLELSGHDFEMLQSFNILVDQWRLEYLPKYLDDPSMTTTLRSTRVEHPVTSSKGVTILYYHLARFQLNSIALRGISAQRSCWASDPTAGPHMTWDRREAANAAIAAATNTVRLIVEDDDLRKKELIGMPIFIHAMIAVCASSLLKMAVVFGEPDKARASTTELQLPRDLAKHGLNFHTAQALANVQNLVHLLAVVADNVSQRHVIRQVVTGLKELLQRFLPESAGSDTYVYLRSHAADLGRGNDSGGMQEGASLNTALVARSEGETVPPRDSVGIAVQYPEFPGTHVNEGLTSLDQQQDPFDLVMGDLDWRFNDNSFLWGIDTSSTYM